MGEGLTVPHLASVRCQEGMDAGDLFVLYRLEEAAQAGRLPEALSALINPARLVSRSSPQLVLCSTLRQEFT